MESLVVSQLLRQLFTQPARHCHRLHAIRHSQNAIYQCQRRRYARASKKDDEGSSSWQQRMDAFPRDMSKELGEYPKVTAKDLRTRQRRPKRVKMLTRDFIEDGLYNPNYGYFSKHATIFNSPEPFDFAAIESGHEFNRLVDQRYVEFEDILDEKSPDDTRQLWHTPTELFKPYYGEAIARYLIAHYRLTLFPYYDLIIYEMGAGNGTLMTNVLDYLRDFDSDVYQRTKFRIVEISSALADLQARNVAEAGHAEHVEILQQSIFDWSTYVPSPCFFLALEVIDNFAHDSIRYDPNSKQPLQGNVLVDNDGEFYEYYEKNLDPVAARYLSVRDRCTRAPYKRPLFSSKLLRLLRYSLPFAPNLSPPEYIPTRLMQFFDILHSYFPAHRLIIADFNHLPDATPGVNAPVVQTRYKRRNVQVKTPFVHQGYFDVFFPTNFEVMEDMYSTITGKLTRVSSHSDFLQRWSYVQDTETRNGENPMLTWYQNASVMTTV